MPLIVTNMIAANSAYPLRAKSVSMYRKSANPSTMPGIGPAMAKRIVDYRRDVRRFDHPGQLSNVKGIGPKKLKLLLEHVTVGP